MVVDLVGSDLTEVDVQTRGATSLFRRRFTTAEDKMIAVYAAGELDVRAVVRRCAVGP